MRAFFKRLKLRYSMYEVFTLAFLIPIAFFFFLILLKHQSAQNKITQRADFCDISEVLVSQTEYPDIETLTYEVVDRQINLKHAINRTYGYIARKQSPLIQIEGNKISITESVFFTKSGINTSSLLDYTIYDIDPNSFYQLKLLSESIKNEPRIININLDLSSKKAGMIIINSEAEVFKNLKYFVNNTKDL